MDKYAAAALLSAEKRKREIEQAYYDRCIKRIEEQKSYEGKRLLINRATTLGILKEELTK